MIIRKVLKTVSYCIYLRKSRADAEAELRGEGETLARHEKALTAFAEHSGLKVTAIYKEIISGETIAARPQMQRLLSEVSEGLWDGVIVMDVDRLARGNSIDQGIISQTFLYAGTKIITPAKTYDPANEFDEEYFEFGLFMSRREYKTINRRLQRGRIASVKEGKYISNKTPFGYERVKLLNDKGYTLSPVPEQAQVVKSIFEWYTDGKLQEDGTRRRIGVSLIARELNERKISTRDGGVWTAPTIRDMLINPVYIGKIRWNWRPQKKKMINGSIVTERPRSSDCQIFDGIHEAIIDEETFNTAQAFMSKNSNRPIRGDKKTQNPLASLVVCGSCGRKMQRRPNPKNPDMLICAEPNCSNHASYIYLVEQRVLECLRKWSDEFEITINSNDKIAVTNTDEQRAELSAVVKSEEKVNSQLDKAFEAFETGIYDAETFRHRSDILRQQLRELSAKKTELQKSIDKAEENERVVKAFIPKVRKVTAIYNDLSDPQVRNDMLKEVIHHIEYVKETRGHGHEEEFSITLFPKLPKI